MNAAFAPSIWTDGLLANTRRVTVSPDGDALERCAAHIRQQLLRSLTIRQTPVSALESLEIARRTASAENWDGYGAKRIDLAAYVKAADFIRALPTSTPVPEVAIDPDGEILIEWAFGSRYILTVSIAGNGRLAYSALIGASRQRGTEWLVDGVPRQILDSVRRIVAAADPAVALT